MTATPLLPLSAQEVCESIRQSRPLDAARLARILRIDAAHGLIEAQAGATWESIAQHLAIVLPAGLFPPRATVGKSIARNAAGTDGRPMVEHVESLTLILPDGQLRRVDRTSGRTLFSLAVGGQGVFGVLYSATLRIESLRRALRNAQAPERFELSEGEACDLRVLLPPEQLAGWMAEAKERCAAWRVPMRRIHLRRTEPENETVLRWARRPYAEATLGLARPCTVGGAVRIRQLRGELVDAAIEHGGSFPIACTPEATGNQIRRCYPELANFFEEQERRDPAGKLENGWSRGLRRIWRGEACAVRWER